MPDMKAFAPDTDTATGQTRLVVEHLTTVCGTGSCPTVYRTNRGTLLVQGYPVSGEQAGVDLPDGEFLVEIPTELLDSLARVDP